MTEVEADLKGNSLVKAMYGIVFETWVIIAVIVLIFIDK